MSKHLRTSSETARAGELTAVAASFRVVALAAAAAMSVGVFFSACKDKKGGGNATKTTDGSRPSDEPPLLHLTPKQARNADISTAQVEAATVEAKAEIQGDVIPEPDSVAKVASRVKGVVDEVKVKQGDRVEKGQVVIVIRSKDLAEAVIGYLEAAKKVSFARRAYLRERKLWKKEISPKATYLQKRQEYSAARLARESAAQRLKAIGFSPAKVRAMSGRSRKELSLYEVETPLAGVVTKRLVTKGQAVTDEAELMEVADLSQVLVEVPVPARYLPVLEKGQEVELRSEKLDMEATGELVYISPTVDQRTRTARARVRVKNPQGKWRPGLCATVKLPTRSVEADVTVPNDAVLEIDGRPHVFVVKKPTVFELRPVTVGLSTGDRTQIRSGLSAGEVVVTGNAVTLKSAWQKMGGR